MDLSDSGAEEDSNLGKKRESNPSNPTRINKRSRIDVDGGNSDTNTGGDSSESDARKNNTINRMQLELSKEKDPNQFEKSVGEGSNNSFDSNFFSMKRCRDALCRMIIVDKLPFHAVDSEWFQKFFLSLQPNLSIPSQDIVLRDCLQLYLEEEKNLKRMLVERKQRVCLTAESWTSTNALNYMVLTAHFIDDDWKLQKRILNFHLVPNRKGDTIGKAIEKCLLNWGIENVFTVMVDNTSYNDGDLTYLTEKIRNRNGVVLNSDFASIVNLMACDALKALHGSTIKIRSAIEYVKSSFKVLETFQSFAMDEEISCKKSLSLDVPTKWSSTYVMLETALEFQKAFERLETEDEEFKAPPLSEDWDDVRAFVELLDVLFCVTVRVLRTSCVASHEIFMSFSS